jgi:hypothetical protein
MADNVPITAGSGTSIAADDVSSVFFQKIKLDVGGDGATDPIATDVAGKLPATVQGRQAHDAADSSNNPVKQGAKAIAHGTNPTAVAASDITDLYANRHGIPFVLNAHPNVKSAVYLTTGAQTDDNVLAAISAGTKYAIVGYQVRLDEATTVGVAVRLGFGTASVPALPSSGADAVDGILDYHPGLVPGSGFGTDDCFAVGGDGEELRITCEAPTSGTLVVRVRYFTIES